MNAKTNSNSNKDLPGKPKTGAWVAGGVGVAALVGTGVFFAMRDANAKGKPQAPKSKDRSRDGGSKGGKRKGGSSDKDKSGGTKGPGGNVPENKKPKEDKTPPEEKKRGREGYFWGDPEKIPEDFDYESNQIFVAPDCSAVAVGYWFFAAGTKDGEHSSVPIAKLVEAIGKDGDPTVRIPRDDHNGVGRQADLLGILAENPKRTVFTWVGEYYGKIASAPGHSSTQLAEDLFSQASQRTGGTNCMTRQDLWPPQLWDFIAYTATRLDEFRLEAYGPRAFGQD